MADTFSGKSGRLNLELEEGDKQLGIQGGHTLKSHVRVGNAQITSRTVANPDPDFVVSRFFDQATAERVLNEAVLSRRPTILAWLRNSSSKRIFVCQEDLSSPVGVGFVKSSGALKNFSSIRVVLIKTGDASRPFYILTAYPIMEALSDFK